MKLKNALAAMVGLSACALVLTGGSNAGADPGSNKVCFYDRVDFGGASYCAAPGIDTPDCDDVWIDGKKTSWNKRIASIKIVGTAKVHIWEGKSYTGPNLDLFHGEADLHHVELTGGKFIDWHKKISSYKTHF